MNPELQRRYCGLFHFYDAQGDGVLSLDSDFRPAAEAIAARWQGQVTPFPNLLALLLETYRHENARRDLDHSGEVDQQEFVQSHASVIEAFGRMPEQTRAFIARAAGVFF